MKLIVASNNAHKVAELDAILSALGFEVCSLKEAGLHVEPEETGETFEENSYIKAKATLAASGCATVADDAERSSRAANVRANCCVKHTARAASV